MGCVSSLIAGPHGRLAAVLTALPLCGACTAPPEARDPSAAAAVAPQRARVESDASPASSARGPGFIELVALVDPRHAPSARVEPLAIAVELTSLLDPLAYTGGARVLAAPAPAVAPLPAGALVRFGHSLPAHNSVSLSGDGTLFVARPSEGPVALFDAASGAERRVLRPEVTSDASQVAFAPDGKSVALVVHAESERSEVRLFDAASGALRRTLAVRAVHYRGLAYAPNGRFLAIAVDPGGDGEHEEYRIWDVDSGSERRLVLKSSQMVDALALAPDGKLLAIARRAPESDDARPAVELYAVDGGRTRWVHALARANALGFSPDGELLAAGDHPTTVLAVASGAELWTSSDTFRGFARDGAFFGWNGAIHECDARTGARRKSFARSDSPDAVAAGPNGTVVALSASGSLLDAWDRKSGAPILLAHGTPATRPSALAFAPDGATLASGWYGGFELWDLATGALRDRRFVDIPLGGLLAPAAGGDPLSVYMAAQKALGPRPIVLAYDAASGRGIASSEARNSVCAFDGSAVRGCVRPPVMGLAARTPDGGLLVVGGGYREPFAIYDAATGALVRPVDGGRKHSAEGLRMTPDSASVIAFGHDPSGIELFRLADGAAAATVSLDDVSVRDVAVAPDGRSLAAACGDGAVRFYALPGLEPAGKLMGHASAVVALAFSSDGRKLASADEDGGILVWDPARAAPEHK